MSILSSPAPEASGVSPPVLSRGRAALELIGGVTLAFGTKAVLDPYIWKFSGPVSLLVFMIVSTIYLHHRGETWTGLGLAGPKGWKSWLLVLPQTLLAFVAILGTGIAFAMLGDVVGLWSTDAVPEGVNERWGDIKGNLPVYLMWLGIVWTSAAFGEELFFRAYLITRSERVFRGVPMAGLLAVIIAALIFGFAHFYYQGLRGWVVTGMIGFALGSLYLLYKRNLWPLILAHGLVDTLAMTGLYLDADW